MGDTWDVQYWDDEERIAYRIQTRRLRVMDTLAIEQGEDRLRDAVDAARRLERELLLLTHGSKVVQVASLDNGPVSKNGSIQWPKGVAWSDFEPTADAIKTRNIPEELRVVWLTAVLNKNPHLLNEYEALKKYLSAIAMVGKLSDWTNSGVIAPAPDSTS